MKKLVRAYLNEAYWFHNGYVPTIDEYMTVALVSSGYMMVAMTSLVGMGQLMTKAGLGWVTSELLIVTAASTFARLMDDMVGHEVYIYMRLNLIFSHTCSIIKVITSTTKLVIKYVISDFVDAIAV